MANTSSVLTRTQRDILYCRALIRQQRRIGSNTEGGRDQHRCHTGPMRPRSRRSLNRAAALIRNVCPLELGGTCVHRSIKKGDGHAFTRVPLRTSRIQVIVREVLLRRNHILRTRRGGRQGKSTHSQHGRGGERGQGTRSAPRPPHTNARQTERTLMVQAHHWRGSQPSSARLAGAISLSDPYV